LFSLIETENRRFSITSNLKGQQVRTSVTWIILAMHAYKLSHNSVVELVW